MLESVMAEVHNFFIQDPNPGTYTISNGVISPAVPLLEGQRIWIVGSALNDGVYTYHQAGITDDDETAGAVLKDETFEGCICSLAVPKAFIDLSKEIADWNTANADALNSPYKSESIIGVYSYEKKGGGGNGAYDTGILNWQAQFSDRLKRWRKVSM